MVVVRGIALMCDGKGEKQKNEFNYRRDLFALWLSLHGLAQLRHRAVVKCNRIFALVKIVTPSMWWNMLVNQQNYEPLIRSVEIVGPACAAASEPAVKNPPCEFISEWRAHATRYECWLDAQRARTHTHVRNCIFHFKRIKRNGEWSATESESAFEFSFFFSRVFESEAGIRNENEKNLAKTKNYVHSTKGREADSEWERMRVLCNVFIFCWRISTGSVFPPQSNSKLK